MWIFNIFKRKTNNSQDYYTSEVFKSSGFPEHTFVSREKIDDDLNEIVKLRNKIPLFLGYSKSGKTVYRRQYFENERFNSVVFRCNNKSKVEDLYFQIAQDLNLSQVISTGDVFSKKSTISNTGSLGQNDIARVSTTISNENQVSYSSSKKIPEINIDVNFICNRIKEKDRIAIILEDYHLVDSKFNNRFSEDLKHLLDEEILLILIGIPSSPNRALRNNPDLAGRVKPLFFDYLTNEEIKEIIKKGENKLNVLFSEQVIEKIIQYSLHNAFLVQVICYELLLIENVKKTQKSVLKISNHSNVELACKAAAKSLDKSYEGIIDVIKAGGRRQQMNKAFNQYEEITKAIETFPIEMLEKGVSYTEIAQNSWDKMDVNIRTKFLENGTYQSETTFKSALINQILAAVERLSDNFKKNNTREIIIVDDKKIFLMDIIFKFYLEWKYKHGV